MLLLKQISVILSTYTADVSGVCSALYEMGGMTVMHDASGCNSTYNTHDEPRWYDMPSMVYISALTEMDALMGGDEKLIDDVCRAASELRPRFIALAGTPIPMMIGTDFKGVARLIEERTGIPTFGFATNGMHSYDKGAGAALAAIAERFCDASVTCAPMAENSRPVVGLLGVTPLDFSVTGNVEALKKIFTDNGFSVGCCWAMGSPWEELMRAGESHVNIVVSSCGVPLAETLKRKYGTPYVTGLPVGRALSRELFDRVRSAAKGEFPQVTCTARKDSGGEIFVIGEFVQSKAIAAALERDYVMRGVRAISPLDFPDESGLLQVLRGARIVIADPLYKPALPRNCRLVPLPHEAYSGRIYRDSIPIIIGEGFNQWIERKLAL